MPNQTGPLVVALLYDGLCTFEFSIVAEVFGLARPEMGDNWYRFESAAIENGPLRAHGGFTINPTTGFEAIERADTIVVPGWKGIREPPPPSLIDSLKRVHNRGGRLVSICSGAFVLAATGLLEGRRVTTHWRYADQMRSQFPSVIVDEKSLYCGENNIFTSAGSAAGIDLMIELVRRDFGVDAANSVARRIVMPAHRSGGQAQFLESPVYAYRDERLAPVLEQIQQQLHLEWDTASIAHAAGMSRRTLERRFAEVTHRTPGQWLIDQRIVAAKDLLLKSNKSIEEVALSVGFGTAHAMRQHFKMRVQLSPTEFRREFSSMPG